MPTSDLSTSIIRTYIPLLVGWIVAQLSSASIEIDPVTVTTVVTAVYYAIVRALEAKFPKVGWLLGKASPPTY